MNSIAFIDIEVNPGNRKILDIGAFLQNGAKFHKNSLPDFMSFLKEAEYICGHNIFNHDIKYLGNEVIKAGFSNDKIIDTLFLSPLLFPARPYHSLLKDDKLQTEEISNPLNDSIKARDLFNDEVAAFRRQEETFKKILYALLKDRKEFAAFFNAINYSEEMVTDIEKEIFLYFKNKICRNSPLRKIITEQPVELAYCLSLININDRDSITPPWVIKSFPAVEQIMFLLRRVPCVRGCEYCLQALDVHKGLKRFFGFNTYRKFGEENLQEQAVKAAIDNKSLLAVFPTGGGKSITFQVPALMSAEATKGLTVIISPLQSLMKDQVDNLEKKGITNVVTINGLLDPIERAKSFERVEDGSASILYISPESLRSKSIERLILRRSITRFVIDEAHCFSSWGQDFRVDYLYIGDFIKAVQEKKNLSETIPVSCFTATAKQKVIEDIIEYFKEKLSLNLELFISNASRTNLQYKVYQKDNEEEKYLTVRELIEEKNCPTIIYVSRTKKAYELANRLNKDGLGAKPYHGKMEKKEKSENQDSFLNGDTQIMVATSAFGMGVDKKDVKLVVHYEISDSLENYIQEAGRAGRDENIVAECFVLYNEDDLTKHFILLNQTKLSIKEVQQVWKAIKDLTKFRSTVSNSALEIARKAGWDEGVHEVETRVKTAIAALEDAGFVKRGQNAPRVFANSILSANANEAIGKINASDKFDVKQKETAIRIIKKLFSTKSKKHLNEELAEARIDYIGDHLGLRTIEVQNIINILREEKILADTKDLTAYIKKGQNINQPLKLVQLYNKIENKLLQNIGFEEKIFHFKELNELLEHQGCENVNVSRIKTILNFWAIKHWIQQEKLHDNKNYIKVNAKHPIDKLEAKLQNRQVLSEFIIELLYNRVKSSELESDEKKEEEIVEFSVHELKEEYEKQLTLHKLNIDIEDIEETLFFLSRIEALKIEGGFLVIYNRLTIERTEEDNRKRYTKDDYQRLNQFYESKIQQIHIVGEYANKMIRDYKDALQFVDDYFRLNFNSFLNKYFNGERQKDISRNLTPSKFKQIFGELSPAQLKIINDKDSKHIAVAAGPGSGKTKLLVHKLASLLLMEDVKHEQLLMLTFSRAAASEFKKRLIGLIKNSAHFVEIRTFHSYCFELLGRIGSLDKAEDLFNRTINAIKNKEVELSKITKTVLVIDEAQDISREEYELIKILMEVNEEMRVIAVGDDDQNIYEFRGSSAKYFEDFITRNTAKVYELVDNYRSSNNLVNFSNQHVVKIKRRLKTSSIMPFQKENGSIKIVRYNSKNLIVPLTNDIISTGLSGSTCILTRTNNEALQITGLLLKQNVIAKLIQTNDAFSLYNLAEIRFFLNALNVNTDSVYYDEELWEKAKKTLKEKYLNTQNCELCLNLIKEFETTSPKKYKSDLESFIRESNFEDFINLNNETIFVSTIHKAKGKEFNNVFLMLDDFSIKNDEEKRLLYVAITRAKNNLTVHLNSNIFDNFSTENLQIIDNNETFLPPEEIILHLTHSDVELGYFRYVQFRVSNLKSGDTLFLTEEGCRNSRKEQVLKFSKKFKELLIEQKNKGFIPVSATVNFIVYWYNKDRNEEHQVLLPAVVFKKQ